MSTTPQRSPTAPLLELTDLDVRFTLSDGSALHALKSLSLTLEPGECLGIVGESGSGKSVLGRTLIGLAGDNARVSAGSFRLNGRNVLSLTERDWRTIRGREVGLVLQDALGSLDPLRTVGAELEEAARVHQRQPRAKLRQTAIDTLSSVSFPDPEARFGQHSFQLSGGQRQRALIASAIINDPDIIIADEPTTALDVTVQQQVVDLLRTLKSRGKSLIFISHDLSVIRQIADRIVVMKDGRAVETGPAEKVLGEPEHEYTRTLIASLPSFVSRGRRLSAEGTPYPVAAVVERFTAAAQAEKHLGASLLSGEALNKTFQRPDGEAIVALHDVGFSVRRGEVLGIVGESGSGKSTLAKAILGLLRPESGRILLHDVDWTALSEARRTPLRRHLQFVSQDPLGSFDPRYSVRDLIAEAIAVSQPRGTAIPAELVDDLLRSVGLPPSVGRRFPRQLSGGQAQRVAIARALAVTPDILVCDEAVSALDVSTQAQVLDLLSELKTDLGLTIIFISHDLRVVHHFCDRVLVMRDGRVVEEGDVESVITRPRHEYTRILLNSVPQGGTEHQPRKAFS